MKRKHLLFLILSIVPLVHLIIFCVLFVLYHTRIEDSLISELIAKYIKKAPVTTEYVHLCPNQDRAINNHLCDGGKIKGFVDDQGYRFVPNGLNVPQAWINRPNAPIKGLETGYGDWMQMLSSKGINSIHLRLDSAKGAVGTIPMQAPPLGYYYIADEYPMDATWSGEWLYSDYHAGSNVDALIDGDDYLTNYPDCRYPHFTVDNCGPKYAAKFSNSNITKILEAAEVYDIKVILTFWGSEQFSSDTRWVYSAYNQTCKKPDESNCSADEAGVLTDSYDIIFDPDGDIPGGTRDGKNVLDYQKQYVEFVYKAWGESEAIWTWEIMNEIHFLAQWNSGPGELDDNVDKRLLPWVEFMAGHIRTMDVHHRPVSISGIQRSWKDGTIADPRKVVSSDGNLCDRTAWKGDGVEFFLACKHKMIEYVDVVNLHDYAASTLKGRLDVLKRLDEIWPDKPKIVGEFLPKQCRQPDCGLDPESYDPIVLEGQNTYIGAYPWHIEVAPFHNTKSYYWLNLIYSGGNSETRRWPGFGVESWREGAAFHFNNEYGVRHFSDIAASTGRFISEVDWSDWGDHVAWDPFVSITDTGLDPADDFVFVSRGDGNQVMLMFRSLNDNSTPIQIRNLEDGPYEVKLFDWLTGELVEAQTVTTQRNVLRFNVDVRWDTRDYNDVRWNAETNRFEGRLVDDYGATYMNPVAPNLGSDWPRLILSDAAPGHELEVINRYRRNIGVVLVEKLDISDDLTN